MKFLPSILVCCVLPLAGRAAVGGALEDALSPDGTMIVVNVPDEGAGDHFEIRDRAGQTLFSEESLRPSYFEGQAQGAEKVLWRRDSQYVAVAFSTSYLGKDTVIFRAENGKIDPNGPHFDSYDPEQDPGKKGDTTQRLPVKWEENGFLKMNISSGHGGGATEKIREKVAMAVCSLDRKKLDDGPRAQFESSSYYRHATQSEFRRLQEAYDPKVFESWKEKLTLVHQGMTKDEVMEVLKARKIEAFFATGAGVTTTIILDDAYYADVLMSPGEQTVISEVKGPIAITYEIFHDPPQAESIKK